MHRNIITNVMFANGYVAKYRYFKQKMLENNYDAIEVVINNLRPEQYDNLRQMIVVEMKVNAVQYCSELATIAICVKNKKTDKFIQILSTMAEKSIEDFYINVPNLSNSDIAKYMGYHEIEITEADIEKYDRSCLRFKNDITKISNFFRVHYPLYLPYKHGLRLIPGKTNEGANLIFEACKDNTLTIHKYPDMWELDTIEITEIIHNMHEKLYTPFFRKKIEYLFNISLKNGNITSSIQSTEPPDYTRPFSLSASYPLPWFVHDGKEPNPFY